MGSFWLLVVGKKVFQFKIQNLAFNILTSFVVGWSLRSVVG
jgi:multisubunit Na+/H+ antiporter MnhE subunit